jgi:hypothetical protein
MKLAATPSRMSLVLPLLLIGGCLGPDGRPIWDWPSSNGTGTGGSAGSTAPVADAGGFSPTGLGGAGGVGGYGGFFPTGLGGAGGSPSDGPPASSPPDVAAPEPLPRPQAVLDACARRGQRAPSSGPDLRPALTRRWLVCSERGLFHRPQAGLELTADGRITLLAWGPGATLVPLRGVDNEGSFDFYEERQLNLHSDLGGTVITRPELSTGLRGLWINNIGAYMYDYVAAEDVDLSAVMVPPTSPPVTNSVPHAACERTPGPVRPTGTIPQLRAAMARRWILCSPWGLLGDRQTSGEVGIEVAADDSYHELVRAPDGQLVRSGPARAVEYIDTSLFNGRPTTQANFGTAHGTVISTPVLTSDADYLIINNNGVYEYRYVAAE